ncbi:SDR family NAD(P)-dependent oxidoreductase [Kurthia sibirica]|uniref:2-hydroxycyclohexanecarboxyl-CoA dehydrogenase n=1 Tax=Kurthia sibirica TaxID=202750 RepID=A0A2U3AN58_9BACL|nr:SDR family NAD(P)-dependent oxidoreductase [Kurthia sibirica]PWI25951.1 2-hydroxycyclohexanecarboxyl-CoA dehydrogenase [Kurthia sibirica]GEK35156.1 2-hydroxycyclohexane-1-carbonyl-CoA dehydrogenase [Kurthia sibirica]
MKNIVFITGAGSGIGRAIALRLSKANYIIAVTDIDLVAAKDTLSLIEETGGKGTALHCDVTDLQSVRTAVEQTLHNYGKITVLVNNAGWDKMEPFIESSPTVWQRIIDINLLGQIHTCHTILPIMITQKIGRIINISSDSARVGSSGEAVYSAAKGGVIAFSKTLAREMAKHKININTVAPGPVDTPLFKEMTASNSGLTSALIKAIPFKKLANPIDIANAVAFLASDDAAYITGQTLSVNGGLTMI